MKSIAAIIAASLVAGFVLGGLGVAGAGSSTPQPVPAMQACGVEGAGACGGEAAAACGTAQACDPSVAAQCDPSDKAACPKNSGEVGACGQGSCP